MHARSEAGFDESELDKSEYPNLKAFMESLMAQDDEPLDEFEENLAQDIESEFFDLSLFDLPSIDEIEVESSLCVGYIEHANKIKPQQDNRVIYYITLEDATFEGDNIKYIAQKIYRQHESRIAQLIVLLNVNNKQLSSKTKIENGLSKFYVQKPTLGTPIELPCFTEIIDFLKSNQIYLYQIEKAKPQLISANTDLTQVE